MQHDSFSVTIIAPTFAEFRKKLLAASRELSQAEINEVGADVEDTDSEESDEAPAKKAAPAATGKRRGRPPGSTNARKKKAASEQDDADEDETEVDADTDTVGGGEEAEEEDLFGDSPKKAKAAAKPAAPSATLDEATAALKKLVMTPKKGTVVAKEILAGFGVARVSELSPDKFGEFVEACKNA